MKQPQANIATAETPRKPGFTVEHFAKFWDKPDPDLAARIATPDVIGDWPGATGPVRGIADYRRRIAEVLALVPDLRLEVAEHASNGDFIFIRWIAHGTGMHGRFECSGIDRLRLRDGLVAENIIRFDTTHWQTLVGKALPWT